MNKISVLLIIICTVSFNIISQGTADHGNESDLNFMELSIEEQFDFYLGITPHAHGAIGFPDIDFYSEKICLNNDIERVFKIAKENALIVPFNFLYGDINRTQTVQDYRFDLLITIFEILFYDGKLNDKMITWISNYYHEQLEVYLKEERRIDENVILLVSFIDFGLQNIPYDNVEELGIYIYQKYLIEMNVIDKKDICIEERYVFEDFTGDIVKR